MEIEVSAQAKDKRINRMVAITVVILSVFTGVCTIKDGNIVQAMDQAQSNSVDAWSQYQATRTKLHLAQDTETMLGVMTAGPSAIRARAALARLDGEIAKYQAEAPGLERGGWRWWKPPYRWRRSRRYAKAWGCCSRAGPSAQPACSWECAALPDGGSTPTCSAISWGEEKEPGVEAKPHCQMPGPSIWRQQAVSGPAVTARGERWSGQPDPKIMPITA